MVRLQTLNSWKEIADYLHRSVRTVQRWEARFGLPVRHRAGKRTSVFAIEAELNSWLQTRSTFRLVEHDLPAAYEKIFHVAPVALGVINDRREWVDANGNMIEILGRSKHELNGARLDDVVIENDRGNLSAAWEMMLSRGDVSNLLLVQALEGNDPTWVEFRGIASVAPGLHLIALTRASVGSSRLQKAVGYDENR
jgi:PAS domain-containing protein